MSEAWPLNNIFNFLSLTWQNANGAMLSDENLVQLLETNVLGVLPEALTAHVQTVLADQTVSV